MTQLKRIRWAVRGVLILGLLASTVGNVLHANNNLVSQSISAWPVLALYLTIELLSRVPVTGTGLAVARRAAAVVIAGIAAWVSYWHMAGVAARYGETGASPYLLPLSVDGLIVVASICLVELGGRIRELESSIPVSVPVSAGPPPVDPAGPIFQYAQPTGPAPAPVDRVSTSVVRSRKPQPSSRERVEKAHRRTPDATNEQLAERLNLSTKTVSRWRPAREEKPAEPVKVNGREPVLEDAPV